MSDDSPKVVSVRINRKKYFRPWKESRGDVNVAVRYGPYMGIWNPEVGTTELYDVVVDPGEQIDLSSERRETVTIIQDFARSWFEQCEDRGLQAGTAEISQETEDQLRTLGYVE